MTPLEYLNDVAHEIARHGNRDNQHFILAFQVANLTLNNKPRLLDEIELFSRAAATCRALQNGARSYVQGSDWYEPAVSAAYAQLIEDFRQVPQPHEQPA